RYRQPGRCLLLAVCLALVWLPRPSPAADNSPLPHVLVLSSYHLGYTWSDDIIAGIRAAFTETGQAVEFSHEFLDAKRFVETPSYHEHLADLLNLKYRNRPIDLLILSDNSAFDFATTYRRKLFPQAPVVFCGINDYTPAMRQKIPGSTGVAEIKEMGATLDAMIGINPRLARVAIVCDDTRTGRIDAGLIGQAAGARDLEYEMLSGGFLSLTELLERLRNLPPHTAVFFGSFWRDRFGAAKDVDEILPRITEAAPVPVYTHADTFVMGGVGGGVVVNAHQQGLLAGDIAVRILRGARPETIPVVSRSNIPVFDHAALERWQIDRRLLPAGAVVINLPPPSLYERYTALVWGVIATFVVLLSLLGGLVVNMAFRRRAEEALRSKTEELERYFTSSLDLLGIADTEGRFLRLNPEWEKSLGYSIAELEGRFFMDFVHPEDIAATRAALARLADQEAVLNFENRYRHKDGSYRWIEWRSVPQGHLVYAAARDITRRKQNAEALRASEERFRLLAELAPVGIVISGRDEKPLYVSPKFVEIFGYGMDEMPSVEAWWSQAYPDEDLRLRVRREWSAAIAEARDKCSEIGPLVYPVTCKDGRVRQIEFRMKATESLNVLVVTDVSERKQAEEERERLMGQLAQSQKMESVGR
ncbi:MAG TPA: ABC transporter substrate binding protein, partial [Desulfosarcina sp.]|nr:ABC transporter substrate binding protein [Desulfosarcina sp.]